MEPALAAPCGREVKRDRHRPGAGRRSKRPSLHPATLRSAVVWPDRARSCRHAAPLCGAGPAQADGEDAGGAYRMCGQIVQEICTIIVEIVMLAKVVPEQGASYARKCS